MYLHVFDLSKFQEPCFIAYNTPFYEIKWTPYLFEQGWTSLIWKLQVEVEILQLEVSI